MRLRDFKNLESVSQKGLGFLEGPKTMFLTETAMYMYKTIFMTFTVHEVQAKLQELQYCMRAQIIGNRLGHAFKYLLTFSFIIIT